MRSFQISKIHLTIGNLFLYLSTFSLAFELCLIHFFFFTFSYTFRVVLVSFFKQTLNILEKACRHMNYKFLRLDGDTLGIIEHNERFILFFVYLQLIDSSFYSYFLLVLFFSQKQTRFS